jgi:hypothetical protein
MAVEIEITLEWLQGNRALAHDQLPFRCDVQQGKIAIVPAALGHCPQNHVFGSLYRSFHSSWSFMTITSALPLHSIFTVYWGNSSLRLLCMMM